MKPKIYIDLDEFLLDYLPESLNDNYTRKQIGFILERDGNLISLGTESFCSYSFRCNRNCGWYSDCSVVHNQLIRSKKLERIIK
jgi:hypothetical protein